MIGGPKRDTDAPLRQQRIRVRREGGAAVTTGRSTSGIHSRISPGLALRLGLDDSSGVISVAGEVDHYTCEKLRLVINGVLASGATSLLFDCDELVFIDSGGIAVLAEAVGHTNARGGKVTISHPSSTLRRLLGVTGLDALVEIT